MDGCIIVSIEGTILKAAARIKEVLAMNYDFESHGTRHQTALYVASVMTSGAVIIRSDGGSLRVLTPESARNGVAYDCEEDVGDDLDGQESATHDAQVVDNCTQSSVIDIEVAKPGDILNSFSGAFRVLLSRIRSAVKDGAQSKITSPIAMLGSRSQWPGEQGVLGKGQWAGAQRLGEQQQWPERQQSGCFRHPMQIR